MKNYFVILLVLFVGLTSFSQNLDELDSYTVDEFYQKIEFDDETLDEDGDEIDFVFVKTSPKLDAGKYEIELTDGPGDLYEIKGTELFVKFRGYYGYAGYADNCILEITSSYYGSATIYKLE